MILLFLIKLQSGEWNEINSIIVMGGEGVEKFYFFIMLSGNQCGLDFVRYYICKFCVVYFVYQLECEFWNCDIGRKQ